MDYFAHSRLIRSAHGNAMEKAEGCVVFGLKPSHRITQRSHQGIAAVYDCVVMLELKSSGLPSRLTAGLVRMFLSSVPVAISTDKLKNHKKAVKNKQARTREPEEYKAEARKACLV
ncbi:hypothetical protein Tco_1220122 [Tanacetum coccineum]